MKGYKAELRNLHLLAKAEGEQVSILFHTFLANSGNFDFGFPLQQMPKEKQQEALQQMAQAVQQGQGDQGQPQQEFGGSRVVNNNPYEVDLHLNNIRNMIHEEMKKGGWINKAVNPAHKGYCTPMTKSTCTPRRKAFAKTMKKHHGFHKK